MLVTEWCERPLTVRWESLRLIYLQDKPQVASVIAARNCHGRTFGSRFIEKNNLATNRVLRIRIP